MGLDEALLESRDAPPTLRMYTWSPDTLSLGYFQRLEDVPAAARDGSSPPGAVVRRITGGGAIHHAGELTFSITASLEHPLYRGPVADSYRRVHEAIARSLRDHGVEATARGEAALDSDRPGTGLCFHHSTPLDLVWGGRKGVGSAQRRKHGRVLHHGSIKLTGSAIEEGVATLAVNGAGMCGPGAAAFAPALRAAFEETLGIRLEADVPDAEERRRAHVLATRYLDPAFLRRR